MRWVVAGGLACAYAPRSGSRVRARDGFRAGLSAMRGALVDAIVSPALLYAGMVVGAIGMLIALPRRGVNPQLIGVIVSAAGIAAVLAGLGFVAIQDADGLENADLPNPVFYLVAALSILSAIRVVTHKRPVYSALYFILTVLASCVMYLLLSAEFMAFALVIIYAGAILITYLFVIMLATQAPSEEEQSAVEGEDVDAKDPVIAVGCGFFLAAVLSVAMAQGAGTVTPRSALETDGTVTQAMTGEALVEALPGKVIRSLERRGAFEVFDRGDDLRADLADGQGPVVIDGELGTVSLILKDGSEQRLEELVESRPRFAALFGDAGPQIGDGRVVSMRIPEDARATNLDGVGWALIAGHPMTLEIAGVILLMAMLGAVVLARKQIEIGDDEKEVQARLIREGGVLPGPTDGEDMVPARADGSSAQGGAS